MEKEIINEKGNIISCEDRCDILTGEAREALEYNITCCKDCYRFDICLKAESKEKNNGILL
jgi:hypothetical protein